MVKVRIEKRKINDVIPAEYNPRKDLASGDKEYEKIKRSIETFGYVDPIIVNERTGAIVGGHQRIKVLKDLGYKEIEVSVVDLTDEKEKALNVALNKISGDWDTTLLKDLLQDLDDGDFDMGLTGFDMDEIEDMMTQFHVEDEVKEDDFDIEGATDEASENTKSRSGEVWQLGNHKLIVGDATKENDMLALLGDKQADMVFTDPPYNVDYEGGTGLKIKNDKMDNDVFYQFLLDAHKNMYNVTKPGGALYVCHADSEGVNFRRSFEDSGFLLKQCLIWVKNQLVMGRQDYHWKHEPILYGWKPGASHNWYVGRKETTVQELPVDLSVETKKDHSILTVNNGINNVVIKVKDFEIIHDGNDETTTIWRVEKPHRNADHPTMKPVRLCARAISNSTKPGDIVLDPFGGSGSTLIACEQTGRHCRIVEFDPIYADVIIRRWEELTGMEAINIS
ncbi:site-specific DNA-methyltransferase [Salipaludibacillus sp. CF4.18]|uniref:site-specific DNA-methyltransferase n=1 Tax=Salipaludibacillus sp. CF4.18 TaxID=3373081 RepID=UPI003EE56AEB